MKKLLSVLLCAILVMTLFMSTAMACERTAPTASEMKKLECMVTAANQEIKAMVITAQLTPWDDVAWLKVSTEAVAVAVKAYARCIGATVVCEYVTYEVDGQYVEIDPLRVVHKENKEDT